jgi:hypothetical protein
MTVSFVRAEGVLAKGRMRPAGRMFDMPGLEYVSCLWMETSFFKASLWVSFLLLSFYPKREADSR